MKKTFAILGMICGLIICIMGITAMDDLYWGNYVDSYNLYGADFYTDVYEATAAAANNVDNIGDAFAEGIGYLLIAVGLSDICYFGTKLGKKEAPAAPIVVTAMGTDAAQQTASPSYEETERSDAQETI